jgi:hypothetical protein
MAIEDAIQAPYAPVISPEELMDTTGSLIDTQDDGSVVIDFNPQEEIPVDDGHTANLAEVLDDDYLEEIATELIDLYEEDRESRSEWEEVYTKGISLLGLKIEERDEPFPGASGVHHPILAEAVTQFQSQAFKEMCPANGPVDTAIVGVETDEKVAQSNRVKEFMNYNVMHVMEEYESEMDQMLFYLPLSGSAFKKIYYDGAIDRPISTYITADDLVVPYETSDLRTASRVTHVIRMSANDIRKQQQVGFYSNTDDVGQGSELDESDAKTILDEASGQQNNSGSSIGGDYNDIHTLLEMHIDLNLEGFEDEDEDGQTGIAIPYIITIDKDTERVLSIRKNWKEGDDNRKKIAYFCHYKFLPGLGFYGFGLIHMIGGVTYAATAILRQLIDAGTLSNLPGGFKARGLRIQGDDEPIAPGEWRDVDTTGASIRDSLMPLPYKEPSNTLSALLGVLVDTGRRFASITDTQVGDSRQDMPVGTTVALLEKGSQIMSAVHKRLHGAQKMEFKMLARIIHENMPDDYPYEIEGGENMIKKSDFDERVDIIPVSDPNIFSMAQRVMMAQQQLQLAQASPEIHDVREAYRRMYHALGVDNVDKILPPEPELEPLDPITENMNAMTGRPLKAFEWENHEAHIESHAQMLQNPAYQQVQGMQSVLTAHIQEHLALKYKVEAEQILGQPIPNAKDIDPATASQIAQQAAQATAQITGKDQQLAQAMQQPPIDPATQAKMEQEAAKLEQKNKVDEERSAIELTRLKSQEKMQREKMDLEYQQHQETIAASRENALLDADVAEGQMYTQLLNEQKRSKTQKEVANARKKEGAAPKQGTSK